MRGGESECRLQRAGLDVRELPRRAAVDASNAFNNEILASQSASLVKTADVNSASKRDTEGFRAEDGWGNSECTDTSAVHDLL